VEEEQKMQSGWPTSLRALVEADSVNLEARRYQGGPSGGELEKSDSVLGGANLDYTD